MKRLTNKLVLLLITGVLFFSCEQKVDMEVSTILSVINGNSDLTILKDALDRNTDLVEVLESESGSLTLFAPTNQAFEEWIATMPEANALEDVSDEMLDEFLNYHVVSGATIMLANMKSGDSLATMQGELITFDVDGINVKLNGHADVISADFESENGVLHVINSVLIPEQYRPLNNEFSFKKNNYALEWGYFLNYGTSDGSGIAFTNYDIVITEVVEDLSEINNGIEYESNYYIYLWLESLGDTFSTGRYNFNSDGFDGSEENFVYSGSVWFKDQDMIINVIGGFVDVSIEGSDYVLAMELEMEDGEILKGHMKHPLEDLSHNEGIKILNTGDIQDSEFNFYVDEIRYPIEIGVITDKGNLNGDGYVYEIILYSKSLSEQDSLGGHILYVDLISGSTMSWDDGRYEFDSENTPRTNRFKDSFVIVNKNQGLEKYLNIKDGHFEISTRNRMIDISFELVDTYGNIITGEYTGEL